MFGLITKDLALDRLQVGDVVISGSRTWKSAGIQLSTGSVFSHAAIVLDPLLWFESITQGIGYKVIKPDLCISNDQIRCLTRVPRGEWVKVLRPAELEAATRDELYVLLTSLIDISYEHFQLDYPGVEEFLEMIRLGLGDLKAVRKAAKRIDPNNKPTFPGTFCSALAVGCLREAGIDVFPGKSAKTITPGTLARSKGFRVINASCSPEKVLPERFQSLEEGAARNFAHADMTIRGSMQTGVAGKAVARMNETLAAHHKTLTSLTTDNAQRANLENLGRAIAKDHEEAKAHFHQNRKKRNPLKIQIVPILTWWEQFRSAAECLSGCKDQRPVGAYCEPTQCLEIINVGLNFKFRLPEGLRPLFAEYDRFFSEEVWKEKSSNGGTEAGQSSTTS